MNLKGKTIVLGITGGIAAYKMPNVAHALAKAGANVHVLMTKNATEFITPLVFETLTNHRYPGGPLPQAGGPRHEHPYAGKPHHPG